MCNDSSLLKIRVYPSLDFSIGANVPPKKDNGESGTKIVCDSYFLSGKLHTLREVSVREQAIARMLRKHPGVLSDQQRANLFEAYESEYLQALEADDRGKALKSIEKIEKLLSNPSAMGLSIAVNSHNPKRRRGLKGISPYGKRMTRSALVVLEERYGLVNLTLGTATLPALTPDEYEKVCINWSEIVRKFFQELGRELERKGLDSNYVQVTEIQEKRFNRLGDFCPHLHFVFPGRPDRTYGWSFTPSEIRELWCRILQNCVGRELDCSAATRIESCKTSLLAELGKYLTKGVGIVQAAISAGKQDLVPSSWWGCSAPLRASVQSAIVNINGLAALWIDRNIRALRDEGQIWYVDIWIERDGRETRVGAVGRFLSKEDCEQVCSVAQEFATHQMAIEFN